MSTSKAHRLLIAGVGALTAGALVAGCSSSNKTAAGGGTTGNATTSSSPTGSAVADLSAPASTDASPSATKSFASGSGKGSKFCNELGSIAAAQAKLGPSGDTPSDLKQSLAKLETLKGALVGSAPSSIKGDLSTMFDYITKLDGLLSKAGYDWTKVNPADLAGFEADAQKFETASQNVDNYVTQACGIDTGGGSDTGASPSN